MDRHERAELAVRMVGLALVVSATGWLAVGVYWVWLLTGRAALARLASMGGMLLAQALIGLVGAALAARPAPVARLLAARPSEEGDSAPGELLRLGLFALAAVFVGYGLVRAGWALSAERRYLVSAGASWLLAAVLVARPWPFTAWLAALTRSREGWSPAAALSTGVALVSLYRIGMRLVGLAELPGAIAHASGAPGWSEAQAHAWLVQSVVASGAGLACPVLALAFCGPLGRWLGAGAPKSPRRVLSALGNGDWVRLTFQAAALFVIVEALLTGILDATTAASGWSTVVVVLPAVGLTVLAAWPGAALARHFYPVWSEILDLEPGEEVYMLRRGEPSDRPSLAVALEVAVTLVALLWLLASPSYSSSGRVPVWRLATVGVLLVLRGDIARWCVPGGGRGPEGARRRRAALYPWLALLGVFLVERWAGTAVFRGLTLAGLLHEQAGPAVPGAITMHPWPPFWVSFAAGLLLILARRPLSWLLSYGPLLHRRRATGTGAAE